MNDITALHEQDTLLWHQQAPKLVADGFLRLVQANHQYNFLLWHEEDKARRDDQGYAFVYRAKRNIDRYNQARNDFMEKVDVWLVDNLKVSDEVGDFHSETPGMMIDRLSILALKAYHMQEQFERDDVDQKHRTDCGEKLAIIHRQLFDLRQALADLLKAIVAKKKSFRVYRQCKMYNDAALNPQLYRGGEVP